MTIYDFRISNIFVSKDVEFYKYIFPSPRSCPKKLKFNKLPGTHCLNQATIFSIKSATENIKFSFKGSLLGQKHKRQACGKSATTE